MEVRSLHKFDWKRTNEFRSLYYVSIGSKWLGTDFLLHPYVWKKPSKPACGQAVTSDPAYFLTLPLKHQILLPLNGKNTTPNSDRLYSSSSTTFKIYLLENCKR